jgi:hypothetical protein
MPVSSPAILRGFRFTFTTYNANFTYMRFSRQMGCTSCACTYSITLFIWDMMQPKIGAASCMRDYCSRADETLGYFTDVRISPTQTNMGLAVSILRRDFPAQLGSSPHTPCQDHHARTAMGAAPQSNIFTLGATIDIAGDSSCSAINSDPHLTNLAPFCMIGRSAGNRPSH